MEHACNRRHFDLERPSLFVPRFPAHLTRLKVSKWNGKDKRMSEADDDGGPLTKCLHWIRGLDIGQDVIYMNEVYLHANEEV